MSSRVVVEGVITHTVKFDRTFIKALATEGRAVTRTFLSLWLKIKGAGPFFLDAGPRKGSPFFLVGNMARY